MSWRSGPSIFRSFVRFDFGLDLGLVLGSFWARLGRLLGPFLELKSGQVGPQIHLEAVFVQKNRCSRNIGKRKARATFWAPRWAQDRLKTGPRRVQERSKSDAFFVLIFDSFWDRLWGRLGAPLGTPSRPKIRREFGKTRSCFRSYDGMVPRWLQDRSKRAPGGGLGPLLGALGCSRALFGGSWGALGSS